MKRFLFALLLLPFLSACSSVSMHTNPEVDLKKFKRYYVEHRLTDNHALDELIVKDLRRRGLEASYGPITMMPDNTEVLIVYEDRWTWDFKSYLIELNLQARDVRKEKLIATGNFRDPGPFSKSAAEMITSLLDSMLK